MIKLAEKISLKEQEQILRESLKKDIHLAELLRQNGLSYDNLRYKNYINGFNIEGKI